jgi:hypothetical protein
MKFFSTAALLLFFVTHLAANQSQSITNPATADELKRITQELMDAIAPGNKGPWEKYLAPDWLLTDENGEHMSRAQFLDQLRPLPAGYSGNIRVTDPQVRDYADIVVIAHRDLESEKVFGQEINTTYVTTDTWRRQNRRWQLIATHIAVLPSELKPVKVDPGSFDAYVGDYELAPGVRYIVTHEGDKLFGQRTGRKKEELLPAGESDFFLAGRPRGLKIFAKDERGKTSQLLDRRDNNDIVWKKMK